MGFYPAIDHEDRCIQCFSKIQHPQERYCSASCQQKAYRQRKFDELRKRAGIPATKLCRFCGAVFMVTSLKQDACSDVEDEDGETEASYECIEAREAYEDARDDALAAVAKARRNAVCAGPDCDKPAGWSGNGRPRKFCTNRCKTREMRARKAGA
ncbi:hypothetical protein ACLQ2N_34690 [Streptomyces sp. DT224]|uniref:hypothetical protein n=1 Tax=Streptomyces sp. DT224 TaxID=3393426 RepID=UPI003CE96E96